MLSECSRDIWLWPHARTLAYVSAPWGYLDCRHVRIIIIIKLTNYLFSMPGNKFEYSQS